MECRRSTIYHRAAVLIKCLSAQQTALSTSAGWTSWCSSPGHPRYCPAYPGGREGQAVVERVGHLRQFDIQAQRVQRLARLVLLTQLLEVLGIDVVQAVTLVAQIDAREIAIAQFLGTLQQAAGDVKAVKVAFIGLTHVEGQFLHGVVPGLHHLDVDAVVGGVQVLEFDARDDLLAASTTKSTDSKA